MYMSTIYVRFIQNDDVCNAIDMDFQPNTLYTGRKKRPKHIKAFLKQLNTNETLHIITQST